MKRKITWRMQFILLLALTALIGFIPWESWFPLEIRDKTLRMLESGNLGLGALLLLTCLGFGPLLRQAKGMIQGFLLLLTPFVIIGTAMVFLVSIFFSQLGWNDVAVYKNGGEYLVVQKLDEYSIQSNESWRIVRTGSVNEMVRWIKEQHPIERNSKYVTIKDSVTFSNKTWHKIQVDEDP